MAGTFNVDTLIADAKAARVQAEQDAAAAAKAAAIAKKNKDAINNARLQAEPQITYAKSLESEMLTLEGTLRNYATQIARGDKLDPIAQAEFDRAVTQYKSLQNVYTKTNENVVKIFNAAPGADVSKFTGNKDLGTKTVDATGKVVDKAPAGIAYGDYTVAPQGGVNDKSGNQVMFVSTKRADGTIETQTFTSANGGSDAAVNALLKNYSTPEALKSFQQELINKHYSNAANLQNGQWKNDAKKLINDYSSRFIADAQSVPGAIATSTLDYLSKTSALGGAGTPTQYRTITTRGDAKKELDNYLTDLIGRPSTAQEEEAYYTQLHASEQKAVRTTSNGTTTGSELSVNDHVLLAANVAKKSLAGTDVEKLLTSGSRAATDIATLQEYAASYGVDMSAADALKYVAAGIGQQDYIKKQEERIRQTAMVLHPQLKDHFQAGGTYKDIADQYAYAKSKKLGVAVPVSTADKDVADAVARGISINNFNTELQGKAEWRKTPEAHNTVDNFINNIAQTWGLG